MWEATQSDFKELSPLLNSIAERKVDQTYVLRRFKSDRCSVNPKIDLEKARKDLKDL
jgi:hypothetical protein